MTTFIKTTATTDENTSIILQQEVVEVNGKTIPVDVPHQKLYAKDENLDALIAEVPEPFLSSILLVWGVER